MANRNNGLPTPTTAEISRFLDLQKAEIEVRSQELILRSKEIDANQKNAQQSIDAQVQVEKLRQEAFLSHHKTRAWLIGLSIIGGIAIVITAIFLNKDQIAIELLKQVAIAIGSFAGGYAVGKHKPDS
jgi:hypothetical protein